MYECLARINGENGEEVFSTDVEEKWNFYLLMRIYLDCGIDVNYLLTDCHVFSDTMRGWRNW